MSEIGTVAAVGFVNSALAQVERQRAEQERLMDRMGANSVLAQAERQHAEQKRLMDRMGANSALAQVERQHAEQERLMDRMGANSVLAQYQRLTECILMKSALAQQIHPFAELDCTTSESVGIETIEARPTGQERELAAEVQDCAIELLALLIEEDLPEWLATNRSALARELAVAAHSFIVGFMRVTSRSPELYSLKSSDLSQLLLLPRN